MPRVPIWEIRAEVHVTSCPKVFVCSTTKLERNYDTKNLESLKQVHCRTVTPVQVFICLAKIEHLALDDLIARHSMVLNDAPVTMFFAVFDAAFCPKEYAHVTVLRESSSQIKGVGRHYKLILVIRLREINKYAAKQADHSVGRRIAKVGLMPGAGRVGLFFLGRALGRIFWINWIAF